MAGSRTHFLSLLENDFVCAFCAYNSDFMPFKAQILEKNIFKAFAKDIEKCVFMNQIHSNKVEFFDEKKKDFVCDGLITNKRKIALCVLSADCFPLLWWQEKGVIGALHSGRKGTCLNILKQSIKTMQNYDKSLKTEALHLVIGAGICALNYEIKAELLEQIQQEFPQFLYENKFDLKALIKAQAKELGIKKLKDIEICTFENEAFYSYRKDKTQKRFVSVIYLK